LIDFKLSDGKISENTTYGARANVSCTFELTPDVLFRFASQSRTKRNSGGQIRTYPDVTSGCAHLKRRIVMDEILEILENDARLTAEEIAKMTKKPLAKIKSLIKQYEKDGVILKYKTVINKELLKDDNIGVRALIEVNVVPQKNVGFDYLAERIYRFPEVTSCYLLSGTYDLLLIVEGKDIQTVSNFIAEKLAPMENVRGTVTHFLLKKYKEDNQILKRSERTKRPAISF